MDTPARPFDGSVIAATSAKSDRTPLEMNVLEPLRIQSSPSFFAKVRMPARSEPAPGSVMARQPMSSPAFIGARYFCLSSSDANLARYGATRSLSVPKDTTMEPQSACVSSSLRTWL